MSFTTRRRHLSCFYCGQKSSHKFEGKAQQFHCKHCEAVNYLDKHGHITDPPVTSTSSVTSSFRFAHAPDRPTSPLPVETDDIFCQKCLKNQHLLKENLASYLPAEDDPSYDDYLDSYDGYRRNLEQRYPQVCATCAPKVTEKIKKASYAAKSDHLRRMMDKTRQSSPGNAQGLISTIVLRIAGLGWATSAAAQVCWHAMSAMSVPQAWSLDEYQESLYIDNLTAQQCAQQLMNEKRLHKACVMPLSSWMPYVLLLALCTVWWNNKSRYVLWRRNVVSGGLKELYVLQGTALLGRVFSWYFLSSETPRLAGDVLKAAHVFMVLFIVLTSILMLNTVKLDLSPKVNFNIDGTALLGPIGDAAPEPGGLASSHPLHRKDDFQPFPINRLASSSNNNIYQQARQAPYRQATPSPERYVSDTDAMDWTPSTRSTLTSFYPPVLQSDPTMSAAISGPSPFHGGLPAAPQPPAHRLLKPAALQPGALRKVSATQKEAFATTFSTFKVKPGSTHAQYRDDEDETTATEDESGLTRRVGKKRREMEIADPKFWPQSDFQKDTGLESMFGESFTMTDGPAGVRVKRGRNTNTEGATSLGSGVVGNAEGGKSWTSWAMLGAVPTACLGVAVVLVKGGVL